MLFGTPIFLFLFLPITLGLYYLLPNKLRNAFLLIISLVFYTWGEQKMVLLIIASTLVDYTAAIIIDKGKRKLGLYLSMFFNLSILFYFKYASFAFENINTVFRMFNQGALSHEYILNVVLPIGISFYTFQTMSYTIDVYRGSVKANYKLVDFACYVALFPQLIAGPIVKYKEIESQLKRRGFSIDQFSQGVTRFVIGLFKKMVIANNCAYLVDGIFILPESELNTVVAWVGAIAYSLQLYFDFSAYSDMAIGLGKMFGFDFLENFNYPYISRSISEFWRRWHISLSSWFRDYLYIPLGGNKNGLGNTVVNILIVFLITGIWHGASWVFVIWGIYHGFFIVLEKLVLNNFLKSNKFISHIYTLLIVVVGFVIFRSDSLSYASSFIKEMVTFNFDFNVEHLLFYFNNEVAIAIFLGIIFSMPLYKIMSLKLFKPNPTLHLVLLMFVFCLSVVYVSLDTYNPFIYFRF